MKKFINKYGTECYSSVSLDSPFSSSLFHPCAEWNKEDDRFALHTNIGSMIVLDKKLNRFDEQTRVIETGFMDKGYKVWLAGGMCDVRESKAETFGEAIKWIKERANICRPER